MSEPLIAWDDRRAAQRQQAERAREAGRVAAARAWASELAWRNAAAESWREAAGRLSEVSGTVRLTTEDVDGGVKVFVRPADALVELGDLLAPCARLLEVREIAP